METVFLLLAILSLMAFIIGMFNPKIVLPFKSKTRGKVALLYVSSFIVFSIIGASTSKTPTAEKPKSKEQKEVQQNEQENQEVESAIGKPIEIGNFLYTIQSVSFRKSVGGQFMEETADGIFMLIKISIKNISDETKTLDNSLFKVTDANDVEYSFASKASASLEMSGKETLFLKQCQPNITTNGFLIYEVPEKGEYYLHLIGSSWGTSSVRVPLK